MTCSEIKEMIRFWRGIVPNTPNNRWLIREYVEVMDALEQQVKLKAQQDGVEPQAIRHLPSA